MSSPSPRNFRSIAIDQHLTKMFQCIVAGNPYERDDYFKKLDKYQSEAAKLNDLYLQGRVYSIRGTLHLTASDLTSAQECYHRAREFYEQANNPDRAFGMDNNLGLLEVQRGNYAQAVETFKHSLSLLSADDPNRSFKTSMVQINMAMAYLALFDYQTALEVLEASMANYGELLEYVRVHSSDSAFIVEQRTFLGMAQLGVGRLEAALSSASLGMEFAEQTDTGYTRLLSLVLITRLSAQTSMTWQSPDDLLDQIEAILRHVSDDIYIFVVLREEGRYYVQVGTPELARWFGERALKMSQLLGSAELQSSAQAILDGA